jgi:hypothetical protein
LEGQNATNFATLASGATLQSLIVPGGVKDRINGYIDQTNLILGGNCADNQNAVIPCQIPDPANPGQFIANPATVGAAVGNIGRNTFRGPFQQNCDMSLIKRTKITERASIDFRAEFFNVFNHASFQSPQAGGGSFGNYGLVDVSTGDSSTNATVGSPRIIQFGLKFNF